MSSATTEPSSPSPAPNHRARTLIIAAVVVVTLGLLLKGVLTPAPPATPPPGAKPLPAAPVVGHYAPNITLRNLSNQPVTLSSFKGKVVLVNFWYVACEPCRYEMPALEHAYQQYQAQGLVVLGIDTVDDPATIDTFVNALGITYPIVRDVDLRAAVTYSITATPSTFFVDRDGVIRYRALGPLDTSTLRSELPALLK